MIIDDSTDVDLLSNWHTSRYAVGGPVPSQLRRLLHVLDGACILQLGGNPWAEPPASIVVKGPKGIRGYFEDLYSEPCRIKRNSVKVVLVGQEGAGKTRLEKVVLLWAADFLGTLNASGTYITQSLAVGKTAPVFEYAAVLHKCSYTLA